MQSIHRPFNIFLSIGDLINKKIIFVSEYTPKYSKYFNWIPLKLAQKIAYQGFKSLYMAWTVFKGKDIDAIVIFEHKAQHSALLYSICILKRVPVFFFVHGLQQTANRSLMHRLGFEFLLFIEKRFNFWPIHIEIGDEILDPSKRFTKSVVLPHPLPQGIRFITRKAQTHRIRLGIVGMLRADKPILPLIDKLLAFTESRTDVELIVGLPLRQLTPELKQRAITFTDTSTPMQYLMLLSSIDILITAFEQQSFYFRPSGVINDAAACGCYIIAPNLPIIKAQISTPTTIGKTYENDEDLIPEIEKAITHVRTEMVNFDAWRAFRSEQKLLPQLAHEMEKVIILSRSTVLPP